MRIVMIILTLILISCKKEIEPKPAVPNKQSDSLYQSQTSALFTFGFCLDSTGESINRIVIKNRTDGSQFQELTPSENSCLYAKTQPHEVIHLHDFNFDGFTDFKINNGVGGSGPDETQQCWIYSPSRKSFVKDPVLSSITAFEVDSVHKELIQDFRRDSYERNIFVYENGRFVLVRHFTYETGKNDSTIIHKFEVKNGTEKLVESKTVSVTDTVTHFDL